MQTKKLLSVILAVVMVFSLMPMIVISAENSTYAAMIGENGYATLAEAINASKSGDTIVLVANIDLTDWESVDVKKAITLDGNGKTVTGLTVPLVNNSSADFTVMNLSISGANIEVKSAAGTDNDTSAAALVQWLNGGMLTLNNVSVTDSTIKGDGYVAALVGFIDSPATGLIVNGGAITGNTLIAGGTVGAVAGHTYADVTVAGVTVSDNSLTSTSDGGTRPDKVGLVVGRLSQDTVSISAAVDESNKATPAGEINEHRVIGSIPGGTAVINGGSYPSDPTVTGKAEQSASIPDNYAVIANPDGSFAVKEFFPAYIGTIGYATLADAIAAANDGDTITLADGEHIIPSISKAIELTITGSENAVIELANPGYDGGVGTANSTLTFEGVTVKFNDENYRGFKHTAKVTYTDCTIEGVQFLYAPEVTFTDCIFNVTGDNYAVWTYGASNVSFNDCVFNTDGKAVLVYTEAAHTATINVSGCTFNATTNRSKAAVEVGQSAYGNKANYTLNISNSTADSNFVANKSTSNLWGNKNEMESEGLIVNLDGVEVTSHYTVTFDPMGGTVSPKTVSVLYGNTLSDFPIPTRVGMYVFDGWYTAPIGGTRVTTSTVIYGDTTVYAHWDYFSIVPPNANYYLLTFDTNGGTDISSVRRVSGTVIDLTDYVPTREGYEFDGWYLDKAMTEKVNKLKIVKNTTVYAGWIVTNPFDDVSEKDAYYDDVVFVHMMGLMEGTGNNKFSPMKTLNRATIVTTLWRLSGAPVVDTAVTFTDLGDYWYTDAMNWAIKNEIILGYGNGLCKPLADVTHEQLVAILYRYAVLCEYDVPMPEDVATDIAHSTWSDAEVKYAEYNGLFADINDASAVANRAEIAGYLHRFCKLYEIEK